MKLIHCICSVVFSITSYSLLACGPENVKLEKLNGREEYEMLNVYGILTHTCPEATGVQLKLTVYDRKGNIADVRDQWPASINNIPPNKPYKFALIANTGGKNGKFEVEPIAVKVWKK